MHIVPEQKQCIACGQTKPIAEFYAMRRRGRVDRRSRCRTCQRQLEGRQERADPKRNEKLKRRREKWPEKERARKAIAKRLERGTITKPDHCEGCGKQFPSRQIQAHHRDYSKPLEVDWLCQSCHRAVHRQEKAAAVA